MPETPEPPLLNPVLTLQMDPRPEPRPGGGKDASKIVTSRLLQQQEVLASACEQIFRQRCQRRSKFGPWRRSKKGPLVDAGYGVAGCPGNP